MVCRLRYPSITFLISKQAEGCASTMAHAIRNGRTISSVPFGYDRNGRRLGTVRRIKDDRLRHCWAYPLIDGPGIALLVCLPPFLAIMALPVIDLLVQFRPDNALNPVNLLIVPFTMPLVVSFGLTVGYILLFLGRMLTASSLGDEHHPRFPAWNRIEILEELARWIWAGLMGAVIGGFPAASFWVRCGDLDALDWFLFLDLVLLGVSYAQMALMAALFNETLLAANPITVLSSIARVGWGYLTPCLVTAASVLVASWCWFLVLYHSAGVGWGVVGLWACWVLTLYLAMALTRMLGFLYARHSQALGWFETGERA